MPCVVTTVFVVTGDLVPNTVSVLASSHSQAMIEHETCKVVVPKGHSPKKCAKASTTVTTHTVHGVIPAGFMAVDSQGDVYVNSDPYPLVKGLRLDRYSRIGTGWDSVRINLITRAVLPLMVRATCM